MLRFTRTDWRATGIDPTVFWRDVLEVFTMLGSFGVTYGHENTLMRNLDAEQDRELLERVVDDLHASYAADRLDWAARDVKGLLESVYCDKRRITFPFVSVIRQQPPPEGAGQTTDCSRRYCCSRSMPLPWIALRRLSSVQYAGSR
jgi:hypothetical protein